MPVSIPSVRTSRFPFFDNLRVEKMGARACTMVRRAPCGSRAPSRRYQVGRQQLEGHVRWACTLATAASSWVVSTLLLAKGTLLPSLRSFAPSHLLLSDTHATVFCSIASRLSFLCPLLELPATSMNDRRVRERDARGHRSARRGSTPPIPCFPHRDVQARHGQAPPSTCSTTVFLFPDALRGHEGAEDGHAGEVQVLFCDSATR